MRASTILPVSALLTLVLGIANLTVGGEQYLSPVNESLAASGTPAPGMSRETLDDLLLDRSSSTVASSCYYDDPCSDYNCGYMCPPRQGCDSSCHTIICTTNERCKESNCMGGCSFQPNDDHMTCHEQMGF